MTFVFICLTSFGLAQSRGKVEGFIGFADAYPNRSAIRITKDQSVCGHKKLEENFVIDPNTKGLANVVVYWKKPAGQNSGNQNLTSVTISQTQCRYEPHIQVGSPGSTLIIKNEDGILHNIHAFDENGETLFNIAQPGVIKRMSRNIGGVAKVVNFKCDVHNWMNGYVLLLENVEYAITDSTGRYRLEGVLTGEQEIYIWHEVLGEIVKTVSIDSKEPGVFDLVIESNE